MSKNCAICLYDKVCVERRGDARVKDCCIPEAPLRALQAKTPAKSVYAFKTVTKRYLQEVKSKSKYWSSHKY